MTRTLWAAIVLLACVYFAQAEVSIQYADCPDDCSCEKRALASILSCKRLITGNNSLADMPISKFELTQTDGPITLGENVFLNMGLTHVNVISIANVSIESIDKNAFNGLKELTHIRMTHSKISSLHPDTFKNITKLKKLSLVGNPLSKDTVIFSKSLEQLRLDHCGLNEIPVTMFDQLPMLTYVDLTGNGIEELPLEVFDSLYNIEEINLAHNKLKQFPNQLFVKNEVLNVLDLSFNPLTSFSSEHVSSLETLNLGSCLLKEIDANMFKDMRYLYSLDLSNNKIANIEPTAFADMFEVASIDLSGNELRFLNENLFVNNVDLKKVNLDNNVKLIKLPVHGFKAPKPSFAIHYFSCNNCNLKSLSRNTFKNMPALVTLRLSHNNIEDVSTGVFQNLTSLIDLDLSYNKITTIDDETFKKNTNLNKLNLSFNTLKALHSNMFRQNENLKYLDISNCGLYQLWTGDSNKIQIPSILAINASYNNIELIKKEDIAITNRIRSLDISNNKLQCSADLRDLIMYLENNQVKNTDYTTHEKLSYDFEAREKEEASWSQFAKNMCPDLLDEDEEEDIEDEEYEEDMEVDTDDYGNEETPTVGNVIYRDELAYPEDDVVLPYHHQKRFQYSYMWPILVFLGTALAVLGFVANIILFVIRRRQSMPVPRIINVPRMSRLKKNSGLVYQQLSEEHGPKTPILSRFAPIPTVHGNCPESEHV